MSAYLMYNGAVYRVAQPPELAPAPAGKPAPKPTVHRPPPKAQPSGPPKDVYQKKPKSAPAPEKEVEEGKPINLTPKQVLPAWHSMYEVSVEKEKQIEQEVQKLLSRLGQILADSFAEKAKNSPYKDMVALADYIKKYPDFKNLFTFKPPEYKGVSKYFDLNNSKEAQLALQSFVMKINRYAKQEEWFTYKPESTRAI